MSSSKAPEDDHADDLLFTAEDDLDAIKEHLEKANGRWAGLAKAAPVEE